MTNSVNKSQIGKALLIIICIFLHNQTNLVAQEAFVSLGIEGAYSQSFCAGQMINSTIMGTSGSASHGVLQTYEISIAPEISGTETVIGHSVELSVFPNPTADFLVLTHQYQGNSSLSASVYDPAGITLDLRAKIDNRTIFDLKHLVPGIYFLKVKDGTNTIKTFKIVKN